MFTQIHYTLPGQINSEIFKSAQRYKQVVYFAPIDSKEHGQHPTKC